MRFIITGRNIEVTEGLRNAVQEKIGKLEHYFTPDTEIHVTLSVEKDRQKIEVTIPLKGTIIRSEQTSTDMYVSIDLVEEIIERQLRRYKTRIVDKKQAGSETDFSQAYMDADYEDEGIKIVRTKRFGIKPMDPEEACVQMELLGHSFYVFFNRKPSPRPLRKRPPIRLPEAVTVSRPSRSTLDDRDLPARKWCIL